MNPGPASGGGWRRRDARADYERHHAGPNMTPMVDVVMVILIFFMASTVILGPELLLATGLEARVPETPPGDPRFAIESPVFEVVVGVERGPAGIVPVVSGFGLVRAPLDELPGAARALAREAGADVRIVVAPEDDAPYEAVVRTQDLLRDAGFEAISLR